MSNSRYATVIDTNVLVVANGRNTHATNQCIQACIKELGDVTNKGIVLIDNEEHILDEYEKNCKRYPQDPGNRFYVYLMDNRGNSEKVADISLTPINGWRKYKEFPNDPALKRFDRSDQKFVATARASKSSPYILNAVDSDYSHHKTALKNNGVKVKELCPKCLKPPPLPSPQTGSGTP